MRLHAIAAAITGKSPDKTRFTCTSIAADRHDCTTREVLSDHTFSSLINVGSRDEVAATSAQFIETIAGVVAIQATFAQGQKPRPVPLIIGTDSRESYDISELLEKALEMSSEKLDASKRQLSGIFDQIILEKGCFTVGKVESKQQLRKKLEAGGLPRNEKLVSLKKRLDNQDPKAFEEIIDLAKQYGASFADLYKQDAKKRGYMISPLLVIKAPWDDYADRPDLQARYPIYCFTTWDPRIKEAVVESFVKELGIKQNIYLKPATETRSPYFSDVALSMIWDQFDVVDGKRSDEDITPAFDKVIRERFLPNFKEIYGK